jgi:hypothetical protein
VVEDNTLGLLKASLVDAKVNAEIPNVAPYGKTNCSLSPSALAPVYMLIVTVTPV